MASSFLSVRLGLLLVLMVGCALGGVAAIMLSKAYVAGAILIAVAFLQAFLMAYALGAHQREIARFIDAVRFSDLSQSFSDRQMAQRLASSLNSALGRLRETTASRDAEAALLRALFEHAPVAVLAIRPGGRIDTMNEAARRLFGRGQVATIEDVKRISLDLAEAFRLDAPPGRSLVRADIDGREARMVVAAASMRMRGSEMRIVSLQNIESELGGAEFDAWRDLVRVLTHEIMNTLTPVASLSQLIKTLASDVRIAIDAKDGEKAAKAVAADISESADALNARAEALLRFIGSYRQLTHLPPPRRTDVQISNLLERLRTLQESDKSGPGLKVHVQPQGLRVTADADQLEQALLNLIANARDATLAAGRKAPVEIDVVADRGGAVAFTVTDAGGGVPPEIRDRMFTPFFSTKAGGSGVGLSLVRQIALAHGGSIEHRPREGVGFGSVFCLRLPQN
ncbi:MAG TPA: ATP-binding protein [Hyphomonadaceae bacterium]|jgi:nitrogen fixation/metabolism regulation signal transduction histidine kinase|nr:ATP-binding protein [Hyphomonadaceae bacterium]